MRCTKHDLALAPDGKCVLCRRDEAHATVRVDGAIGAHAQPLRPWMAGAALVAAAIAVGAWGVRRATVERTRIGPVAVVAPPRDDDRRAEAPERLVPPLESAALPPDRPVPAIARAEPGDGRSARLTEAMHAVPITVYSTSWCPHCKRARAWLLANGYAFTDRDVEHDAQAARQQRMLTGQGAVPVIDVDGQALVGFDERRVSRAIEYAAAKRLQR